MLYQRSFANSLSGRLRGREEERNRYVPCDSFTCTEERAWARCALCNTIPRGRGEPGGSGGDGGGEKNEEGLCLATRSHERISFVWSCVVLFLSCVCVKPYRPSCAKRLSGRLRGREDKRNRSMPCDSFTRTEERAWTRCVLCDTAVP